MLTLCRDFRYFETFKFPAKFEHFGKVKVDEILLFQILIQSSRQSTKVNKSEFPAKQNLLKLYILTLQNFPRISKICRKLSLKNPNIR